MNDFSPWLVALPMMWGALAFLLGPGRGAPFGIGMSAIQLLLALAMASSILHGEAAVHAVGGWPGPLGIELVADGLATLMLVLAQVVCLPILVFARAYFRAHPEGSEYFWPFSGFLMGALNALFLSGDVFNLYVTLELVSLAAVGLVASGRSTGSVTAGLRYLFATLLGSGAYLLGVALLYGSFGAVAITTLAGLMNAEAPAAVRYAGLLILIGLVIKTALFPFHFWLPPAHGGAPSPVSALLSALVIKASFYLIVRLWLGVFSPVTTEHLALALGVLGSIAILYGSAMAYRQVRLKMLIAYSTVAQIGYLFLLFPLVTNTPESAARNALDGAMMQAVAHGLAKAAMFAAAGCIIFAAGHDRIERLGGLSGRQPLTLFAFGLAGVTLMGLPPSSGFIAKWLLISGAVAAGQWYWVVVIIAGGLLAAGYVFKVLRHAFLRQEQSAEFKRVPPSMEWSAVALALASLVLGVESSNLLALVDLP